jgi:hypothetical protein
MFGPIAEIRRHCIISIAVSNWNFLCSEKQYCGSCRRSREKNEGFEVLKSA